MHATFLNTHVVISELADADGSLQTSVYDNAKDAHTLFEHRVQLPQGAGDNDGDGDQTDTRYRWIAWYGKGRLIKYRKMDQ